MHNEKDMQLLSNIIERKNLKAENKKENVNVKSINNVKLANSDCDRALSKIWVLMRAKTINSMGSISQSLINGLKEWLHKKQYWRNDAQ